MGPDSNPSTNTPSTPPQNAIEEVFVSTATAIITTINNPYRILVATSGKHKLPVLPGGKIEHCDFNDDIKKTALNCIIREVKEETGSDIKNPRLIGNANDPDRDIRIVPISKVNGSVYSPELPTTLSSDTEVKAHYGCPDYIFVGQMDESLIIETGELKNLRFIDIINLKPGTLSAGHDLIVIAYRDMINSCQNVLPENSLRSFATELERYSRRVG